MGRKYRSAVWGLKCVLHLTKFSKRLDRRHRIKLQSLKPRLNWRRFRRGGLCQPLLFTRLLKEQRELPDVSAARGTLGRAAVFLELQQHALGLSQHMLRQA